MLLIRRLQTIDDEVMETTKTELHQRQTLPRELLGVLRWHVNEQILHTRMRQSDLLFPSVTGGFRARSALDKPFDEVSKASTSRSTSRRVGCGVRIRTLLCCRHP